MTAFFQAVEHSSFKPEEILYQIPVQTTNISILSSGTADHQLVNYAPIMHTFPAAQADSCVYDVESAAPLIIFSPITSLNGTTQMTAATSERGASDMIVEIPSNTTVSNEVRVDFLPFRIVSLK